MRVVCPLRGFQSIGRSHGLWFRILWPVDQSRFLGRDMMPALVLGLESVAGAIDVPVKARDLA